MKFLGLIVFILSLQSMSAAAIEDGKYPKEYTRTNTAANSCESDSCDANSMGGTIAETAPINYNQRVAAILAGKTTDPVAKPETNR